jgi:hypothetical protein
MHTKAVALPFTIRALCCALLGACVAAEPELSPLALDTPIAVTSSPAEAPPGAELSFEVVVAGPAGSVPSPRLAYAFCTSRRAPGENGAVSQRCARDFESAPTRLLGVRFTARIPADACKRYGPDTPAGTRPEDADESGGYYQPLRIALGDRVLVHRQRVRCPLGNTPVDDTRRYAREYTENRAPRIAALRVEGARAVLEVEPDSAERYLRYEPARAALAYARERLEVRWWSAGAPLADAFSDVRDGRAEVSFVDRTPSALWAVLMDDRGGVAVASSEDAEVQAGP